MITVDNERGNLDSVYRLRYRAFNRTFPSVAYEFPDGRVSDLVDRIYSDTEQFGCRDSAGTLLGAFRINTDEPLPLRRYWNPPVVANSMEISRLVIDPLIQNPLKRYGILFSMVQRATKFALDEKKSRVYTTAGPSLAPTYTRLFGFEHADETLVRISPGVEEDIALLSLDLDEKNMRRARRVFSL